MNVYGEIYGVLQTGGNVLGEITKQGNITASFQIPEAVETRQKYDGEYIVIPKTEQRVLETKDMVMNDDLLVKAIPFYEVSNAAKGETIIIGGKM